MEKIKVSVIVCCYNQEKYIKQTLDSILSQEHPYSYEILVCDDASKDSTPKIVAEYASRNSEIVPVIRKENLGVVKNFFDAVSRCHGEYIMVCAGDDYYLQGKIKKQIEYMDKYPEIGLIHSDIQAFFDNRNEMQIIQGKSYQSLIDLLKDYSVKAPTMCIRRKDLYDFIADVKPSEHDWLMEDLPISLWFHAHNKARYLSGVLVNYRIIEGSACHSQNPEKLFRFEKSAFSIVKFFQSKFPEQLSEEFIYHRHILDLLYKPKIISYYPDYCKSILDVYDKLNSDKLNFVFRLRLKYHSLNRIFVVANSLRIKKLIWVIKRKFVKFEKTQL